MKRPKLTLPLWAYILMNLLVIGVFYGVYEGAMAYARYNNFVIVGLVPILAVCYLAFFLVSIIDLLIDRFSHDTKQNKHSNLQDTGKKNDPT